MLVGGWWRKENRPASHHIFHDYDDVPPEALRFLQQCAMLLSRSTHGLATDVSPVYAGKSKVPQDLFLVWQRAAKVCLSALGGARSSCCALCLVERSSCSLSTRCLPPHKRQTWYMQNVSLAVCRRATHTHACRYYKSAEHRPREMDMYPPGRIIFVRPLKTLVGRRGHGRRLEKGWDTVWVTPQELIAEGILISGKVRGCSRGL